MGQTLTHGVYLPDEGERNCYNGLAANWQILDTSVGTIAEHTAALAGKAPAMHTHTKADITDLFNSANTWSGENSFTSANINIKSSNFSLGDTVSSNQVKRFQWYDASNNRYACIAVNYATDKSVWIDIPLRTKNTEGTSFIDKTIRFQVKPDNTSAFLPVTNSATDLGSSSYQWNNLYAKSYYYNGVAWGLDKANEWSKTNKFSVSISPSDITGIDSNTMAFTALRSVIFFNTTGSSNRQSYGTFLYSGYTAGSKPDNYGQLQLLRSTDKKGETNNGLIPDTSFTMWRVAPHYLIMDFMNSVRVTNDGTENSLKPITNNATDLGTSDNKWKSLNGINPGALSLPDMSSGTGVSLSAGSNSYSPPSSGWLSINLTGAISVVCGNFCHSGTDMLSVPVVKGSTYTVTVATSGTAYLFVSQGNV